MRYSRHLDLVIHVPDPENPAKMGKGINFSPRCNLISLLKTISTNRCPPILQRNIINLIQPNPPTLLASSNPTLPLPPLNTPPLPIQSLAPPTQRHHRGPLDPFLCLRPLLDFNKRSALSQFLQEPHKRKVLVAAFQPGADFAGECLVLENKGFKSRPLEHNTKSVLR